MIAYRFPVNYLCECAFQMSCEPVDGKLALRCVNHECDHYGKLFDPPTVELQERSQ